MGLCGEHCGQNWIGSQDSSSEALSVMLSGLELILKVGHWEEAGEAHCPISYMEVMIRYVLEKIVQLHCVGWITVGVL